MSTLFAATLGIVLGLIAGYFGGSVDAFIMRAADIQSTFPAILIAMLVDGTSRALFGSQRNDQIVFVMVLDRGFVPVQYARMSAADLGREEQGLRARRPADRHPPGADPSSRR
jgi:peptide/nickel transport system permease protein